MDNEARQLIQNIVRLCAADVSLRIEPNPTCVEVCTDASKSHGGLATVGGDYLASVPFSGTYFKKAGLSDIAAAKGDIPIYLLELYVVLIAVMYAPRNNDLIVHCDN